MCLVALTTSLLTTGRMSVLDRNNTGVPYQQYDEVQACITLKLVCLHTVIARLTAGQG